MNDGELPTDGRDIVPDGRVTAAPEKPPDGRETPPPRPPRPNAGLIKSTNSDANSVATKILEYRVFIIKFQFSETKKGIRIRNPDDVTKMEIKRSYATHYSLRFIYLSRSRLGL